MCGWRLSIEQASRQESFVRDALSTFPLVTVPSTAPSAPVDIAASIAGGQWKKTAEALWLHDLKREAAVEGQSLRPLMAEAADHGSVKRLELRGNCLAHDTRVCVGSYSLT